MTIGLSRPARHRGVSHVSTIYLRVRLPVTRNPCNFPVVKVSKGGERSDEWLRG